MNTEDFVVEHGVRIFDAPTKNRSGKWKLLAMQMKPPVKDENGEMTYDSVGKTSSGEPLTQKQAVSLSNALTRLGYKGTTRRNCLGYRVWRIA